MFLTSRGSIAAMSPVEGCRGTLVSQCRDKRPGWSSARSATGAVRSIARAKCVGPPARAAWHTPGEASQSGSTVRHSALKLRAKAAFRQPLPLANPQEPRNTGYSNDSPEPPRLEYRVQRTQLIGPSEPIRWDVLRRSRHRNLGRKSRRLAR
jgi:hypothetical protein